MSRGGGHRQENTYRLDAAVERELAHKQETSGTFSRHQPGGGEQSNSHRQVERSSLFANIDGSKIDGDSSGRKFVTGLLDGGLDAILTFLGRALGQADRSELRQALGDIKLPH